MFNPKDRNKLQRYLAKKPTEAVVVPEKKAAVVAAEPAYQQQQQQQHRRPKNHRQQLEQKATSAAATVVVDKSDEPRKLKQKKKKGKKMIAGNDGDKQQQQQISTAEEEEVRGTKVDSDSGENLSSKKNMKKKNKKKKAKEGKSGQAAVAVYDGDDADDVINDETNEPTKAKQNSKKKQKKIAGNNTHHQHNKLQQALSRDVASMIAAFHDKGFVEEEDDEDEDGDFDVEDDLEDEVYEEKEEEEAEEVEEPRAKKPKKEEEKEKEAVITTSTKKNLNQKNLNNKTASAESAKDNNSEAVRRSAELGAKAKQTLAASMFRSLNELLYTSDSKESRRKFTAAQFRLYHQAYEGLAAQWPLQPVDYLIEILKKRLQKRKKNEAGNFVIADVGCGSRARIAEALLPDFSNIEVHSYDLYSSSENSDSSVISADMARLPLDSATVDAAVYSLSLMPTNLKDIIREANRILKPSGQLLVVEVASRFADYQSGSADRRGSLNVAKKGAGENGKEKVVNLDLQRFAADLKPYGFSMTANEPLPPNGFFTYLAFKKTGDAERLTPKSRLPEIVLKACLYKAR